MSQAPPTPPPTGPAEIQDQATTSASATSSAPAPAAVQDSNQIAFHTISNLASQAKWAELVDFAELSELSGERGHTLMLLTVPLVIACLILDDLPRAQHAMDRLPQSLHSNQVLRTLHDLLRATYKRKYPQIYTGAQSLMNEASSKDAGAPLNVLVVQMLTAFIDSFRLRTLALIAQAYTSLPLPLAESYVGLPANTLLPAIETHHWTYDSSTQIITPKALTGSFQGTSGASSLARFDFVANSVARLEL